MLLRERLFSELIVPAWIGGLFENYEHNFVEIRFNPIPFMIEFSIKDVSFVKVILNHCFLFEFLVQATVEF